MSRFFVFDPLIAVWMIAAICALAFIGAIATGGAGLKSFLARTFAIAALGIGLLNPQQVTEERENLPDVALVITDKSASMDIGDRRDTADKMAIDLNAQLRALGDIEVININIEAGDDGSPLAPALIEGLSNLPANRIAGVFAITDGQIHDLPAQSERMVPDGTPFHALIVGSDQARDRRLTAVSAPRFGLVDESVDFQVTVDDPGFEGQTALIQVRLNGAEQATFDVIIGDTVTIPVMVEKRGTNTVEIIAQYVEDELTYYNNVFNSELSGIRDRLRVLLITGEPHSGGRAWRNLLKSDPSVDMLQFTILRPPGKSVGASSREMSLIAFPTRELFEDKLEEFDLVIFDQYRRRRILSPYYIQNISRYVEGGGALLVAAGPPFASSQSLYRSPLSTVLPARPTGELLEEPFRPELTDKGKRHPITSGFNDGTSERWGRWFRAIDASVVSGDVLMSGPDNKPLLVLDQVGDGRTALLLSDQAWLWAKGVDGGGPYNEMFRRVAHWLMGEPDLEAEKLAASIKNGILTVERTTLEDNDQSVRIVTPDDKAGVLKLTRTGPGKYEGQVKAELQGAYRVEDGEIIAIAAAGSLNPKEFAQLLPTTDVLSPMTKATGGHISLRSAGDLPELRRVKPDARASGGSWAGVVAQGQYDVTASKREPYAPVLLFFLLAVLGLGAAWRLEGR